MTTLADRRSRNLAIFLGWRRMNKRQLGLAAGVSPQILTTMSRGSRPTDKNIEALAEALGVDPCSFELPDVSHLLAADRS